MSVVRPLVILSLVALPAAGQQSASIPAVDAVFKDFGPTTPGCALGVYRKGVVSYARGYGMADLNLRVPITPKTMFDIGSTSKQFAAAATVLLALDGKIDLADDVRKYVPELKQYDKTITIDHLLRHTSGLRDYNGLLFLAGHRFEDFTGDDEALEVIVAQRNLNFSPGSRWDYSNTGFFLLSTIIKRVSGKTLAEFARERIFQPLGMTRTHFRDDHTAIMADRATGYAPNPKGGYQIDMSDWDQTGDGAVNTNVLELARWDANFYQPKVGGPELIRRLEERGTLDKGDSISYARGLFVDRYRGLRRVHHGGAWAGYRAMLMRFPDQGVSIGVACNTADANTQDRAERVADVILGKLFPEKKPGFVKKEMGPNPDAAVDPAPFVGLYFDEPRQTTIEIVRREGGISAKAFATTIELFPTGPDGFTAKAFPISIRFAADRRELHLKLLGDEQGPYRRVEPYHPSAADLVELAGSYPSPELATTWSITATGDSAILVSRVFGRTRLEPVQKDAFRAGNGFVSFTRDGSGRITGFDFSASRMQRIRFDRATR